MKTRSNTAAAILSNSEDLQNAYQDAMDAEGSALKENEKYLDSIQGRIDLFINAVQTMWQNTLDSDVIKDFVSLGTEIIKLIDKVGLLNSLFIALSSYVMIKHKMGPITFFKELISLIPKGVKGIQTWIQIAQAKDATILKGVVVKNADTAATTANTVANEANAASSVVSGEAEDKNTADRIENTAATVADTASTNANTGANISNAASNSTKYGKVLKNGKVIGRVKVAKSAAGAANSGAEAAAGAGAGVSTAFTGLAKAVPYILGAVAAIAAAVVIFKLATKDINELSEDLKEAQTEYDSTKTEIESLNDELKTTQEKIAELEAKPSLSFVDQEELAKLKRQNELLERNLKLQEMILAQQETEVKEKAEEYISASWDSSKWYDKKYTIDPSTGVISEDKWYTSGYDTKEALNTAISKYGQIERADKMRSDIITGKVGINFDDGIDYEEYKKLYFAVNGTEAINTKDDFENKLAVGSNVSADKWKELLYNKDWNEEKTEIADGINLILNDPQYANLSYGMSDEIDAFLDEYNAYVLRWKQAQGEYVKSEAISSMFGESSTDEMKTLGKELQEIADNDILTDEQKNQQIQDRINNIDQTNDAYGRLRTTMETVGVTAQNIADYFVLETGTFDSSTVEGVLKQYQTGIEVLQRLNPDKTQIEEELKQYGEGGTVDLLNRPQIDTTKLVEAGWKDAGDGIATVFSSTYSNEDSTIAINFTPILPDGSVLSPDELQEYAEGVIAGTREDDLKLQIGAVFEGEDAITQATAAAEEIHNLQDIYYLPLEIELEDGTIETVEWADLFDWDEAEKEATANAEAISKVLEDADENTREQFGNLVESVAEGKLDFEQAIKSFSLSGIIASTKILEDQWAEVNKTMFKSIDDGAISGWIDTFSELSAALEDVASSMDLLHSAQQQMNGSGRISIKTALELIEATDQWDQMLTITEGTIRLNANAEDILVQSKLNVIKAQVDEALGAVELQLAQLGAADSAYTVAIASDVSDEAYEQYTNAMNSYSASIAAFGAALDAMVSKRWGDVISDFSSTYETAKKIANSSVDTSRIDRTDLEKQRRDLQAQKNMLNQVGTVSSFKNNYDYEKTPGDKYEDKDSDKDEKTAKDLFDELVAEYDRKISTIEYKKDLIQSEIDKAEARGEVASEAFYQRQIELEEKNRQALVNKKKALEDYLKAQGKNMTKEEWADAQEEINSTALAIEECEKNVIDLGQAIEDIHWEYFDKFTSDVDDLGDENSTILSLVGDTDDAVDKNGNWTANGVTQIGLNAQEMQRNLNMADRMQKEKDNIQKSWDEYQRVLAKHGGDANKVTEEEKKKIRDKYDGVLITSEGEYQERMQDVTKRQRDYAKAAKDSKDAIEDLAKARVDKEIEAIEEEIDAYSELIDLKKEELNAERELYEFKKDVEKQTKDIASLERRIASLSGSTDAADVAERRKLQAQLSDSQSGLNDTYYSHAKDAQQDALDKELEAYEKSQRDKIKTLEDTLEDADTLITNAIMDSLLNSKEVLKTIKETAAQYNLEVSPELTDPWRAASIEAGNYKKWLKENVPNGVLAGVTDENGVITLFSKKLDKKINGPWDNAKSAVGRYVTYMGSKDVKNLPSMFTTWQSTIQDIANKWDSVKKAAEKAAQAQIDAANVKVPDNKGKDDEIDDDDNKNIKPPPEVPTAAQKKAAAKKAAQDYINKNKMREGDRSRWGQDPNFKKLLNNYDGKLSDLDAWHGMAQAGTATKYTVVGDSDYVKNNTKTVDGEEYYYDKSTGWYVRISDLKFVSYDGGRSKGYAYNKGTKMYKKYAKGTLGTKKDEWAIDSEPQQGDELVLVPGKGVLSYMRKGTSVIPADLTNNLMEWGKLNPNDLNASNNVNLVNTQVSESEVKLGVNIDGSAQNNIPGLGKSVTEYINDLSDSIQDTDELIEETAKDTVDNSTDAIKSITNLTNKNKSSLSTNLTTPWVNTIQKSKDFETGAKSSYNKIVQYVNEYKGNLESVLSKPYKNLTGNMDGNEVYEFLKYAKKASIDKVIEYANSKKETVKTSLSNGFNSAKSSISEFKQSGTTAINTLKDKFTNKETGLIKALNDTTQAAKNAKAAIEKVPKYSGNSGGSNSSGGGTGSINKTVVPGGYISSGYGYRDPSIGGYAFHGGIDIAAGMGSEIHAPRDGVVSKVVRSNQGYGNYLVIDHGNGIQSLYGHTSSINVSVGDYVKSGDVIALVGSSGNSTGPHCHFEYRLNGVKQNPSKFPRFAKGTTGTKKDQWAVTDEPNFGDELTMYATPEGKLSFMRVGSTVVPADLTKELMDIADIGVDNLTMPKLNSDINLMSNYISKPELNISFDSMVHVDNCSQDTLKDLEKMVDSKINTFSRQLNYSLKRFSK